LHKKLKVKQDVDTDQSCGKITGNLTKKIKINGELEDIVFISLTNMLLSSKYNCTGFVSYSGTFMLGIYYHF
jgi:hypothetical protein